MEFCYETKRLMLRLLHEESAAEVLNFYQENRAVFEDMEPDRPENFYTLEYQTTLLRCEFQMAVKKSALRFWIFEKQQPTKVIGTVSFQNIIRSVYQSCHIGYKFDKHYWHRGYALESIRKAIEVILQEFGLHRIEAFVLPENEPSIRLLQRLGFESEGICRSCIYLHSSWTDHLRYSFINP